MVWTLNPSLVPLAEIPTTPPILRDWRMDEMTRRSDGQEKEMRALEETIAALQATIRGSTRIAVNLQRAVRARDLRIHELENTVRFLEDQLAEYRAALGVRFTPPSLEEACGPTARAPKPRSRLLPREAVPPTPPAG